MKSEIRTKLLKIRNEMEPAHVQSKSDLIAKRLEPLSEFQKAKTILFYFSHGNEVSTIELMSRWLHVKKIYLPKLLSDNRFGVVQCETLDDLVLNQFGIPEPKSEPVGEGIQLDLILIPGVAFDTRGNRIGMGKGYYDRFLALQEQAIKIGLAYEEQILDELPKETYDQTVDMIITEKRIIICNS